MNWRELMKKVGAIPLGVQWRENALKSQKLAWEILDKLKERDARLDSLEASLRAISDEERPTSNATVRRMARMAREALK